jgi:hypothetical protein
MGRDEQQLAAVCQVKKVALNRAFVKDYFQ